MKLQSGNGPDRIAGRSRWKYRSVVGDFPLSGCQMLDADVCPFCIYHDGDCVDCSYHERCQLSNSSYRKLLKLVKNIPDNCYYKRFFFQIFCLRYRCVINERAQFCGEMVRSHGIFG